MKQRQALTYTKKSLKKQCLLVVALYRIFCGGGRKRTKCCFATFFENPRFSMLSDTGNRTRFPDPLRRPIPALAIETERRHKARSISIAGAVGIGPTLVVLETTVLPLNDAPFDTF